MCTVLSGIIFGTFVMNHNLIYAVEVLKRGVYGFGFISSAVGAGSLVAALFVASNTKGNPRLELLFGSAFLISALFVILNFIHSMMVAAGIFILIGFFNIIFATTANVTLQLNSNERFRGRVLSVYSFAFVGTTPMGNLIAGSITEKLGPGMGDQYHFGGRI